MRILLQLPEGLKRFALEYIKKYESDGYTVFLSSSPCYGACDLAVEEARLIKADKIIHFGHSKFLDVNFPVEYVEWYAEINEKKICDAFKKINFKNIAFATTIQYIRSIEKIKKIAEKSGKKLLIGKGRKMQHPGQVVGCNNFAVKEVADSADAVVFLGEGRFHPLILDIKKPVFVIHPRTGTIEDITKEVEKLRKRRNGILAEAINAKTFGILVSTKPGQFNLETAERIKKQLKTLEKDAAILVSNEISAEPIKNFGFFDCFVTTACPRLSEDNERFEKPVLDLQLFNEFISILMK